MTRKMRETLAWLRRAGYLAPRLPRRYPKKPQRPTRKGVK